MTGRFRPAAAATILAAAAAGPGSPAASADPPPRPNIVVVLTDDQGYGELSCHGNPALKTPSLDRLHAESIRFTDFHVSPTCSPTRAALMTGRHEFRSGVTHTLDERERLSPGAVTIAQVLRGAGYATGIFGKWHLGDEDAFQPGRRGFDEVFIHGGGGIGQSYPGSCGDAPGNAYDDPWILHNGTFEKTRGFCTDVFFAQALRWIDARRRADAPFFAWIATNASHAPYVCPPDCARPFRERGFNQDVAAYYGMIANIDENVGRLLDRLREWDLESRTLVIFQTDNGHPGVAKNLHNAGMRGGKGSPYQGGTRVPSFWRWPGVLPSGVDVAALAAHVDVFPTLAALAGADVSGGAPLDGRSLVPLLRDSAAPWPDRSLFIHLGRWPRGGAAAAKHASCAVRTARFRLVDDRELYDLREDPGETRNVIDRFPAEAAAMRADYDRWWDSVQPGLVNEDAVGPPENPFRVRFRRQFDGDPKSSDDQ